MGCGECITVCPTAAISMQPQESQAAYQPVFDDLVANVSKKTDAGMVDTTPKGSQFNQPLLELSLIHILGWNSLDLQNNGRLFKGLSEHPYVYFVHSYYLKAADEAIVTATTEYLSLIHI